MFELMIVTVLWVVAFISFPSTKPSSKSSTFRSMSLSSVSPKLGPQLTLRAELRTHTKPGLHIHERPDQKATEGVPSPGTRRHRGRCQQNKKQGCWIRQ